MKPLLCIRNEASDSLGTALAAFRRDGVPVRELNAWEPGVAWPDPTDLGGIVVFGGSQNADELDGHPYLMSERKLLVAAVDRGVPVLGVCLGAQVLARAFGGTVSRAPAVEFGFCPIFPTADGERDDLLSVIRPGDMLFQWHEDTFGLPPGATLLATGTAITNQAYRVDERAWGIQFHPEITAENLEIWFEMVGEEALEARWGMSPDAIWRQVGEHMAGQVARAHDLFGRFASIAAGR
ncbi:MAG TPA: type 1 glutamine amidotransferase [Actinomycetota bacterium]|jgi:GMP synthase-like glutamine amidotransferase